MSKLGLHVTIGNRTGFGAALLRAATAGSPFPVLMAVDQDLWPDVKQYSPTTRLVFRTQMDALGREIGDGPQNMWRGQPRAEAEAWMQKIMPRWRANRANYYAPINEQDGGDASDMDWLNEFLIRCMEIAEAEGFTLAVPNFSTGNPRDDSALTKFVYSLGHSVPKLVQRLNVSLTRSRAQAAIDNVASIIPGSAEDRWNRLVPALQKARAGGHALTIHQYGLHFGTLMASVPYLALRHRRDAAFLRSREALPKIIINEAGPGVGGINPDVTRWLADLKSYDTELMRDDYVLGACVYQLGGAENIVTGLNRLTDYVAATPTITPPPPDPVTRLTLRVEPRPDSFEVVHSLFDTKQVVIFVPAGATVVEVE